ncbi:MAG TPA: hypothetical protein VKH37_06975 [Ferruginibacter sp.]|nr:hypothetical protein [Ferruginibacter sp.]
MINPKFNFQVDQLLVRILLHLKMIVEHWVLNILALSQICPLQFILYFATNEAPLSRYIQAGPHAPLAYRELE